MTRLHDWTRPPEFHAPGTPLARAAAVVEVVAVFALVHVAYRSFKHSTEVGRREVAAGLNYSAGTTMILASVVLVCLHGRRFRAYGLTLEGWQRHLASGLLWGVLPVLAAGAVVALWRIPIETGKGPSTVTAAIGAVGSLAFTFLFLLLSSRTGGEPRSWASALRLILLIALLSLPALAAAKSGKPVPLALAAAGWLFVGAGFGEEILFRGYVQSRVNESFGRPWRFMGADFGPGLLVSSLLFGFIHVLNTVDYFHGRWDFAWAWGVMNVCSGLFFGMMREKTGSVLSGAIAHGLSGVLQKVPAFLAAR